MLAMATTAARCSVMTCTRSGVGHWAWTAEKERKQEKQGKRAVHSGQFFALCGEARYRYRHPMPGKRRTPIFTQVTDFLLRRRATLDPPRFQGWGRTRHYFEGWYFKVVVPEHNLAYAFIPGISYDRAGQGHAFLQVLNGVAATSEYHAYRTEQFQPAPDRFYLQLGPHTFATDRSAHRPTRPTARSLL